jgi:cytosine/adenosine deaminase-related metal-dependent hydrolase
MLWPARDRVIMPGFVNTHAHLARHLARGLGLRSAAEWRAYDRALSIEDVNRAVSAALVEGLRHGVTTVVDFHRSGGMPRPFAFGSDGRGRPHRRARGHLLRGCRRRHAARAPRGDRRERGLRARTGANGRGKLRGMLGVQATSLHGIETLLAETSKPPARATPCTWTWPST